MARSESFLREVGRHSGQWFITCLLATVRAKSLCLTMSPCSRWTGANDSPAPKRVEVTQLQYSCCACYPRFHTVFPSNEFATKVAGYEVHDHRNDAAVRLCSLEGSSRNCDPPKEKTACMSGSVFCICCSNLAFFTLFFVMCFIFFVVAFFTCLSSCANVSHAFPFAF